MLTDSKREAIVNRLSQADRHALATDYIFSARRSQIPPPGNWKTFLILAGRGFGKTWAATNWVTEEIRAGRARRVGAIARTSADARDTIAEGEAGFLSVAPEGFKPLYEPSKRRLTYPNGAIITLFSSEKPDLLRGPETDLLYFDELASYRYPDVYNQAMFGLRLGDNPRAIITTTPRPRKFLINIAKDPSTVVTGGSTFENRANLAGSFLDHVESVYGSTSQGRQELYGELLAEAPGALWRREWIEGGRLKEPPEEMERIVIGVDPAVTANPNSDESGIVAVGLKDGRFYVLADASFRGTPDAVMGRAIDLWEQFKADSIVVEVNQGGDVWATLINGLGGGRVPVRNVRASRGKYTRAEPVSMRYQQNKVSHCGGGLGDLEDQLCSFLPGETSSDDRLDALVWAVTELDSRSTPDFKFNSNDNYQGDTWSGLRF